jgi:hypothetical protein
LGVRDREGGGRRHRAVHALRAGNDGHKRPANCRAGRGRSCSRRWRFFSPRWILDESTVGWTAGDHPLRNVARSAPRRTVLLSSHLINEVRAGRPSPICKTGARSTAWKKSNALRRKQARSCWLRHGKRGGAMGHARKILKYNCTTCCGIVAYRHRGDPVRRHRSAVPPGGDPPRPLRA